MLTLTICNLKEDTSVETIQDGRRLPNVHKSCKNLSKGILTTQ